MFWLIANTRIEMFQKDNQRPRKVSNPNGNCKIETIVPSAEVRKMARKLFRSNIRGKKEQKNVARILIAIYAALARPGAILMKLPKPVDFDNEQSR